MTPTLSPQRETHSDWVRLRTLILLRWGAITGQIAAIIVAYLFYDIALRLDLCLVVVGAAIAVNIAASSLFPENRRLTETEAMGMLLFDTAQLALLLALTGGLNNPFALLILAPATIAAAALQTRSAIAVGLATITMVSVLGFTDSPILTRSGEAIEVPELFAFGFWLAIVIGVLFLGLYARRVSSEIHSMSDALLAAQMALSREQKLTDLGGVVAAAAHELGTPLATIKLVSAELADELEDRPELCADAELIRDQADRCRDILRSMGRAGKDDLHLRTAPVMAVLREAAEPHLDRGKDILFDACPAPGGPERQPVIYRFPEIIHALRNFIQNAVDFADSTVWVEAEWTSEHLLVRVCDDGAGYAPQVINRIGDPFLSSRRPETERGKRPEYEGMGLGLFIAKTLLERTGASISFSNGKGWRGPDDTGPVRKGAVVAVVWPSDQLIAPEGALGENVPILS